jgi:hypothetical protein
LRSAEPNVGRETKVAQRESKIGLDQQPEHPSAYAGAETGVDYGSAAADGNEERDG